ncbi:hypothetical protein BBJ28_00012720 [Nothophytophthora sp. Chile5]|nr:hypothetical protein BBJ28_00012720 [Nothophytophthora sp. Chile5]
MPAESCYDFPLLKDEVSAIVQDAVLTVLEGNVYDNTKVGHPLKADETQGFPAGLTSALLRLGEQLGDCDDERLR